MCHSSPKVSGAGFCANLFRSEPNKMDRTQIVSIAIDGERTRGSGGVVYVVNGAAKYILLNEIPVSELRERVADMLTDEPEYMIVLEESVQKDVPMVNLWKISRAEVFE